MEFREPKQSTLGAKEKLDKIFEKKKKFTWVAFIVVAVFAFILYRVSSLIYEKNVVTDAATGQKELQENLLKEKVQERLKEIDASLEKNTTEQEEVKKLEEQSERDNAELIAKNESIANSIPADYEELAWKKRLGMLFIDEMGIKFNLREKGNTISVFINNFKQEPENQNRISETDAKIKSILLAPKEVYGEGLDIVISVSSLDDKLILQKRFGLEKYIDLQFFSDSVIYTTADGFETILTEGENILPYIKILRLGEDEYGNAFADLEITQDYMGGENFVYRKITKN